jgi:hypothetical protein
MTKQRRIKRLEKSVADLKVVADELQARVDQLHAAATKRKRKPATAKG